MTQRTPTRSCSCCDECRSETETASASAWSSSRSAGSTACASTVVSAEQARAWCTAGAPAATASWAVASADAVDLKKEDAVKAPVQLNLKLMFDNMDREKMITEAE